MAKENKSVKKTASAEAEWDFVRVKINKTELEKLEFSTNSKKEAIADVREELGLPASTRTRKVMGLSVEQLKELKIEPDEKGVYDYAEIRKALVKKAGI